ncbi:MAG: UDP-N-acetylmuramoyl-L-alanyl-D-glutamate--2,6-diaminopimelate ligase [candidate division WOR-3 bacterium]|nr:UDP-N-acetylmuramoyl-L-alanyl-D-glutamate--2,6-diaminopimelate ligase [candidate division WOR-3 bacterium]MCX7757344.1 UDP-N-acetylmuramoyl-L-alanyl-D-glutamate--2,6-diaminopimelate ligase [candidate division WOR-3 bacterium]MDW7988136.1 UDP-N-acetylmuramoyl-L-alanyl-D-glutamate--2,6-diaminopimelate ligase [candidate division WOR-3 bacterium]
MKRLHDLCKFDDFTIMGNSKCRINGIAYHSQYVKQGYIFVAIDGFSSSGRNYIDEAITNGASAVACEDKNLIKQLAKKYPHVSFIYTTDCRRFLAVAANWFYGFPANDIKLIGITGTDGKTTTSYLIKSILDAAGKPTGLIGTIKYFDGDKYLPATHTTPESLDLVKFLYTLKTKKIKYCVCEVSSHALALNRVYGLNFRVVVFTNISQDHLDFHGTLSAYKKAKLKLFQMVDSNAYSIVNLNDRFSETIIRNTKATIVGYGINIPKVPDSVKLIVTGEIISKTVRGTKVEVKIITRPFNKISKLDVFLPMIGEHNVFNMLAAIATGYVLKIPDKNIISGISICPPVLGRLQKVSEKHGISIYIDYAHTPKGLETAIKSLRDITKGRIIVVFGCGGNRDFQKRPIMGKISTELADFVIVTSDNPRNEDPLKIISDIAKGIEKENYKIIVDRADAINEAIRMAQKNDTILIAGKGHENYQIIGFQKIPYSDFSAVKKSLKYLNIKTKMK